MTSLARRLVTAAAALALGGIVAAPATAAETRPPFYERPATLPAGPGMVIRSEPLSFALDPAQISPLAVTSTRIMYTSTDRAGRPIAVTGSVLVPKAPWIGLTARPVIGFAAGTQGLADRCAPSRQQSEGFEYESIAISGLLAHGYAVAMTDYEGLGTAGEHTYMNRRSQAHTVLDSVRAAMRLPGSGLGASNPVGLYGYSQGGGATAAAAELASSYAPELRVKGAAMGAVPANLLAVADNLDGSPFAEFALYGTSGLFAAYDIDPATYLNATGMAKLAEVRTHCTTQALSNAGLRTSTLTNDGRSASAVMRAELSAIVDDQLIGRLKPAMPVHVSHSALDDTIPYAQGRAMAKSWCAKGANVTFTTGFVPSHAGAMPTSMAEGYAFFEQRFAGLPQVSGCWLL